jgi:uncharacterized integral membrane protein
MRTLKLVLLAILAVLVLTVVAQNTDVITLRLLAWEVRMSRILALSLAVASGFAMGLIAATLVARRRR